MRAKRSSYDQQGHKIDDQQGHKIDDQQGHKIDQKTLVPKIPSKVDTLRTLPLVHLGDEILKIITKEEESLLKDFVWSLNHNLESDSLVREERRD